MNSQFDNCKQAMEELKDALNISDIPLATMLGITERSLNHWKQQPVGELSPKAFRFKRLWEVVRYLHLEYSNLTPEQRRSILDNGRVVIDPHDLDDGTTTLINYIISDPKALAYTGQVNEAVKSFMDDEALEKVDYEGHRSIQHA